MAQNPQQQTPAERQLEEQALRDRMGEIKFKLLVLSGKGGVGKSTVAANLAVALSDAGNNVGLLDVDIHGPSIPKLMGLENRQLGMEGQKILPIQIKDRLKVMSIGFLLSRDTDAVIWRGPLKFNAIRQFLKDVVWGQLDYLVVDSPPGTGDEPLSVAQLVGSPAGAVIVTTPQDVAIADVRRCVSFCNNLSLPVVGIVENMSGFVCPKCGERIDLFKSGGGEALAVEMKVPFLGRIPIDPQIVTSGDAGRPFVDNYILSEAARAFSSVVQKIIGADNQHDSTVEKKNTRKGAHLMKIAVPLAAGRLSMHFGHCEEFAILEVDEQAGKVLNKSLHQAPPHEPGALPRWLHELGANMIIASGMGQRAQQLFIQSGITVIVGASAEEPEQLVSAYLNGTLQTEGNICDH